MHFTNEEIEMMIAIQDNCFHLFAPSWSQKRAKFKTECPKVPYLGKFTSHQKYHCD